MDCPRGLLTGAGDGSLSVRYFMISFTQLCQSGRLR